MHITNESLGYKGKNHHDEHPLVYIDFGLLRYIKAKVSQLQI